MDPNNATSVSAGTDFVSDTRLPVLVRVQVLVEFILFWVLDTEEPSTTSFLEWISDEPV